MIDAASKHKNKRMLLPSDPMVGPMGMRLQDCAPGLRTHAAATKHAGHATWKTNQHPQLPSPLTSPCGEMLAGTIGRHS